MARPAAKASGTVAHETSARRQLSHSMNAKVIASERHEAMNCRMPCPSVSPADAVSLARRLMNSPWRVPSWRATGSRTTAAKSARRMSFTLPTESRTVAAASFGYKQLLHEPFMGGGLWTALAFVLVYQVGWMKIWLFSVAMAVLWSVAAFLVVRHNRRAAGS